MAKADTRRGCRDLNELHLLFDAADGAGDLGSPIGGGRAANQIGDADRPQAAVSAAILQFNISDPAYN
jgi:hypothetical protein